MNPHHAAALALVGWYLIMAAVFPSCVASATLASSVFGSTKAFALARGLSVKPYEVLSAS
jgi:hypothetical protein